MAKYGVSRNDDDMNPIGALARLFSFQKLWSAGNPLRTALYDMEAIDANYRLYCAGTLQIARDYLKNDLIESDHIQEIAQSGVLELIHTCILPFERGNSYVCACKDSRLTLAFQMAHDFDFDFNDPMYENITPKDVGETQKLVTYLRDKSLIGWTDDTEQFARNYQQMRLPVFLVNMETKVMFAASYKEALEKAEHVITRPINACIAV